MVVSREDLERGKGQETSGKNTFFLSLGQHRDIHYQTIQKGWHMWREGEISGLYYCVSDMKDFLEG